MAFGRRNVEEIVMVETNVWECTSDECNCWVRDNFKSSESPQCPMCNSEMKQTVKMLQAVENHTKNLFN
ncbi:MAG TPA: cold-shock protein [Chondromyces sp.]|nr:cold-shock protein [Chondromyces sp.]